MWFSMVSHQTLFLVICWITQSARVESPFNNWMSMLGNAVLLTQIADRSTGLGLTESIDDLLFGEFHRFIDPLRSHGTVEAACLLCF